MEHIQNLLLQTGWSFEDLQSKLNEFKKCSADVIQTSTKSHEPQVTSSIPEEEVGICGSSENNECTSSVERIEPEVTLKVEEEEHEVRWESNLLSEDKSSSDLTSFTSYSHVTPDKSEWQLGNHRPLGNSLLNQCERSPPENKVCVSDDGFSQTVKAEVDVENVHSEGLLLNECSSSSLKLDVMLNEGEEDVCTASSLKSNVTLSKDDEELLLSEGTSGSLKPNITLNKSERDESLKSLPVARNALLNESSIKPFLLLNASDKNAGQLENCLSVENRRRSFLNVKSNVSASQATTSNKSQGKGTLLENHKSFLDYLVNKHNAHSSNKMSSVCDSSVSDKSGDERTFRLANHNNVNSDHTYIKKTSEVPNKFYDIKRPEVINSNLLQLLQKGTPICLERKEHEQRSPSEIVIEKAILCGKPKISTHDNFLRRIRRTYRNRLLRKNIRRSAFIPRISNRNSVGVRSKILLQLELLRMRKSHDFGRDINQTLTPDHVLPISSKKRLSGERGKDENLEINSKDSEISCEENIFLKDVVLSTSNRFVIAEVKSGKELETEEGAGRCSNVNLRTIQPTKTRDITKIKGWKNKRFLSANVSQNNRILFEPKPTCSYADNLGSVSESNESIKISEFDESIKMSESDESIKMSESDKSIKIKCSDNSSEVSKSAFASNNLDGFLHKSASLHISFQIPTLASEGRCSHNNLNKKVRAVGEKVSEIRMKPVESDVLSDRENLLKVQKITNLYKPRTVGQKHRIWKLKNYTRTKKRNIDNQEERKPRTLAEMRRLLDENVEPRRQIQADSAVNREYVIDENLKYSYVLYRGKKIRVPTNSENGVITNIRFTCRNKDYIYLSDKKRKLTPSKNKPSIFSTNNPEEQVVKYRAGPLCKKVQLQEENKHWRSVIKKLPRIYLEVQPRVNRPIRPNLLHLFPNYDFDLTGERIEFALSAVQDKDTTGSSGNSTFVFPLSYANLQENMLFREKLLNTESELSPKQENEVTVNDTVKDIVHRILDYVETKEMSDEIFKEDLNIKHKDEPIENRNAPLRSNTKKKPRRSKTNYELKRLNVKVIEVDLEDKGDVLDCNKEHCKLGCVCNSLATTSSLVSNHCGILECMFECRCDYQKNNKGNLKVTLPIGMDVLSEGAVNRLEHEAKRDLAKVEKEFTQTVIQSNNQTIVVGGHVNRNRRVTKAPKKFNDFVDDPDVDQPYDYFPDFHEKIELRSDQIEWKPCAVNLVKLNLEELVPFCLVHNLHNCHCNFEAPYICTNVDKKEEPVRNVDSSESNSSYVELNRPSSAVSQSCARTRGIPTRHYLIRNRSYEFIVARKNKLTRMYKEYMERLVREEEVHTLSDLEDDKNEKVERHVLDAKTDVDTKKANRRKQHLTIREDNAFEVQDVRKSSKKKAIKRVLKKRKNIGNRKFYERNLRKILQKSVKVSAPPAKIEQNTATKSVPVKKDKGKSKSLVPKPSQNPESQQKLNNVIQDDSLPKFDDLLLANIFANEMLTPSAAVRKKFLQLLGKRNESEAQFRLMPWSGLATRYETNKLQLWYSSFYKIPKILATDMETDTKILPQHYTNIKQFENVPNKTLIKVDFIRWLVTKTVPGGKKGDDVLVILQLTKTHYEVCGICEKTYVDSQSSSNMLLSLIPSSVTEDKTVGSVEADLIDRTINLEMADAQKKQHSIVRKILFSKCKFPKQILCKPIGTDNRSPQDASKQQSLCANLPFITEKSRWRLMRLNSDFSILSLLRNNYAIKYSDLLKIVKMAQNTARTIVLKTRDLDENYLHPSFGIYACPGFEEKIFIGPYYENEDYDVCTLRYVNRVLVKTEIFNEMKGIRPTENGVWLKQLDDKILKEDDIQATIDLTLAESDEETEFVEEQSLLNSESSLSSDVVMDTEVAVGNSVSVREANTNPEIGLEEAKIFSSDDITKFEMSAVDYEVLYNSKDDLVEDSIKVDMQILENQTYFKTNVPMLGYILAHMSGQMTVVRWPSLNNGKKFKSTADAAAWLERELSQCFIVHPEFKIKVKAVAQLNTTVNEPFNPKYLKGYYIVSQYGVKNLLNINATTLKVLGVTAEDIAALAKKRARKLIYDKCCDLAKHFVPLKVLKSKNCSQVIDLITAEIKTYQKTEQEVLLTKQKLLQRKQELIQTLSGVVADITPYVNCRAQTAMFDLLKRHKVSKQDDKPKSEEIECITIDSDEEPSDKSQNAPSNSVQTKTIELNKNSHATTSNLLQFKVTKPFVPINSKIVVRNMQELAIPKLQNAQTTDKVKLGVLKAQNVGIRLKDLGLTVLQDGSIVKGPPVPALVMSERIAISSSNGTPSSNGKISTLPVLPVSACRAKSQVNNKGNVTAVQNIVTSKNVVFKPASTVASESRKTNTIFRPILPAKPKFVIKSPSGKCIKINANELKTIQRKHMMLTTPNSVQGSVTVMNKQSVNDSVASTSIAETPLPKVSKSRLQVLPTLVPLDFDNLMPRTIVKRNIQASTVTSSEAPKT